MIRFGPVSLLLAVSLLIPSLAFAIAHPVAEPATGSMPGVGEIGMASDGNSAIVTFHRGDAVYAVRFDEEGRASEPWVIGSVVLSWKDALDPVWTGSMYWVTWADGGGTRVVRLRADGSVIDTLRIGMNLFQPRAAGSHGRIAFIGRVYGYEIGAIVFDESGSVVAPLFAPFTNPAREHDIAATTDGFLAVSSAWVGLEARRLSPDGVPVDATPIVLESFGPDPTSGAGPGAARIAADDHGSVVVWSSDRDGMPRHLRSARIESDGTFAQANDLGVVSGRTSVAGIGRNGSNFLVLVKDWIMESNPSFDFFAVDGLGARISETRHLLDETGHAIALVRAGSRQILGWTRSFSNGSRVDAASFPYGSDPDPAKLEIQSVSRGTALQLDGMVASDGNGWLAAWIETLAETTTIKAMLIGPDGGPLRGQPIVVRSTSTYLHSPRIVYANGVYLLGWREGWWLMTSRISAAGELLDPLPIAHSQTATDFDLASTGSAFAIAWANDPGMSETSVELEILTPDGLTVNRNHINGDTPSKPGEEIYFYAPQIVRLGERLVVAYVLERATDCGFPFPCPDPPTYEVRAVRFALGGSPADTQSWLLVPDTFPFWLAANEDVAVLLTKNEIRTISNDSDIAVGPPSLLHFADVPVWSEVVEEGFVALYPWKGYLRLEPFAADGTRPGPVRQIDGIRSGQTSLAANASGNVLVAFSRTAPRDQRVYVVLDDEMTVVTTRARPVR